jgi:hypothetical protein
MAAEECYCARRAYQTTPVPLETVAKSTIVSSLESWRTAHGVAPCTKTFFITAGRSCAQRITVIHHQATLVAYSDDPMNGTGTCVAVHSPMVVKIDARPLDENLTTAAAQRDQVQH